MIYAEVLNVLDRANAGSRMATLAYNPDGDIPVIVETEGEGLPRLPSVGIGVRF